MEQEERIAILRSEFGRTTRPLSTTHWQDPNTREGDHAREADQPTRDQAAGRDLQQTAGRSSGIGM